MSLLADMMSSLFDRKTGRLGRARCDGRRIEDLCRDLLTTRGEVSGASLAADIFDAYARLDRDGRLGFFRFLVNDLDLNTTGLANAVARYGIDRDPKAYRALLQQAEPQRLELVRRLNHLPGATELLVGMRADLLEMRADAPELARLDTDLRRLFKSWFNRGFLVLRPISWESPAHILEKIIAYEAVHEIGSWDGLRLRLAPADRRCFAFFHPAMPDEPLIFVEVALTSGIPDSIQALLALGRAPMDPELADTAAFYSISNCQAGLAGISFGSQLIKQVVRDLARDLPGLETFVTLSPIPSLADWLHEKAQHEAATSSREMLRQAAAHYLVEAKRANGQPCDPVARFHLGNGAVLQDVHAEADVSDAGMARSGGAMVNYLYDLDQMAAHHQAYAEDATVACSPVVTALVRQAQVKAA